MGGSGAHDLHLRWNMQACIDCRFCGISKGYYKYLGVDEPIYSNQEFFAIASIGPLVEGWTLIVPKKHHLSMKECYKMDSIDDAIHAVLPTLREQYGDSIVAFEHGANSNNSTTACGTAHAHLHLVPLSASLMPLLESSALMWTVSQPQEVASKVGDSEYLFYSDLSGCGRWADTVGILHKLESPTSQFFRRVIAQQCGKEGYADYKRYPFLDVAIRTRNALSS